MRRSAPLAFALLAFAAPAALAQAVPVPQKRPAVSSPQAAPAPQQQQAEPAPAAPAMEAPAAAADANAGKQRWSACPALMSGAVTGRLGEPLSEGGCGVDSPLLVTAVGRVKLSQEVVITCAMATALAALVPEIDAVARDIMGAPLESLVAGGGYECRNRNRADGAKFSQHAFANALDIAAFNVAGGKSVSVEADWPQPVNAGKEGPPVAQRAATPQARFLSAVHASACARFTTVLGPDADPEHRDHIHLDLGCHGRDCRYMICQ